MNDHVPLPDQMLNGSGVLDLGSIERDQRLRWLRLAHTVRLCALDAPSARPSQLIRSSGQKLPASPGDTRTAPPRSIILTNWSMRNIDDTLICLVRSP